MATSTFADMLLIGIYTGFRPSEIASLRVENVYLDENKLIGGMKTEAGTDREVPIPPHLPHTGFLRLLCTSATPACKPQHGADSVAHVANKICPALLAGLSEVDGGV